MAFIDDLKARNPELFEGEQPEVTTESPAGGMPPGAQQIVGTINNFMPIIEQVTGLTRREIFLQMLKTSARGGSFLDVLTGLTGNKPAPEAKFIKYVKTLALWVPVALFLLGISIVAVYAFLKLTVLMFGGL
jgi:hypothetical protein